MNKKGFTLAEVLGVIIILGLLVMVSFPPLLQQLKKSQSKLSDATLKILSTATEQYIEEHPSQYPMTNGLVYYVKLETLVSNGYLRSPILDASTGQQINESITCIKFKINSANNYDYEITTQCE